MYESLRDRVLALLKVPPEPHPPLGDPASLRVFRAGRNYLRLKMVGWGIAQLFALAGIVFWTGVLIQVESIARAEQTAAAQPAAPAPATSATRTDDTIIAPSTTRNRQQHFDRWKATFVKNVIAASNSQAGSRVPFAKAWAATKRICVEIALLMPPWVFPLVWMLKILGFVVYLFQFVVTWAVMRLDYEMRWYLVTDRSLRLRHGVWVVRESTMSFANIQQVSISQDPVQRLLGLANVRVQSAGGGAPDPRHPGDDMHMGYFHSVTNAEEIRDLILNRLRRFRESGLGDPDEKHTPSTASAAAATAAATSDPALVAARELASEARLLRAVISRLDRG